jgi:glycosyltransferase involved in cell wall biosynthesis
MIVKDEEKFIENCLKSVKNCVDEMVIVDTGSTDRTVEIAKSYGAKVYHHPWENDFSKHRNQSLSYAKGDWIFWIDADEVLEPDGGEIIREAVRNNGIDSLSVTMVCYFENRTRESWNNSIKLFKNNAGILFQGSVHNQVVGCRKTRFCPAKIYHYGYDLDPCNVRKKFNRTSKLLKRAIEREPDNFLHHHNLAVSYSSVRLFQKAVKLGLKAIELYKKTNSKDPNILWTYFVVASSYFNLRMMRKAERFAEDALKINPDHIDSCFVLASIYAKQNNRKAFERNYEHVDRLIKKYQTNPELFGGLVVNKIGEKWRLDLEYGNLFLADGLKTEAEKWIKKAANHAPSPWSVYRSAAITSRAYGFIPMAEYFLEKAFDKGLDRQTAEFEKAMNIRAAGNDSGCRAIMEDLLRTAKIDAPELMAALGTEALKLGKYKQAEALFSASMDLSYHHPKLFTSMALVCKYQNKIDEAAAWNIRALEMDENDSDALINLGHIYFDSKKWDSAKFYYQKALSVNNHQRDVLFRLSLIALMNKDFDGCVGHCELLLKELGRLNTRVIQNIKDVAFIYREIGKGFQTAGKEQLCLEAMNFARILETG